MRVWVEPIGLTRDLQEMCRVDHVASHLGPDPKLLEWFEEHPEGYDFFRAQYHEKLAAKAYRPTLEQLVAASHKGQRFTLLHASDKDDANVAVALHEFLSELEAYLP